MELNFLNTSLIIALTGIIARITDVIKLLSKIIPLFKRRKPAFEIYKIEKSNLNRTINPRFGFSYIEPKNWDRFDPTNNDGNRYLHPNKTDVSFAIWGMYDVFEDGNVWMSIERREKYLKNEKCYKLILSRPCGTYYNNYPDENSVETEKIEAWRLKYKIKDKQTGKRVTVIEFLCNYNNKRYTILCQARNKDFLMFEDFFLFLISEFRILAD
jgi:hypothetical protein